MPSGGKKLNISCPFVGRLVAHLCFKLSGVAGREGMYPARLCLGCGSTAIHICVPSLFALMDKAEGLNCTFEFSECSCIFRALTV